MSYSNSNSEKPRVAVIIPYFSGTEQLSRCIDCILNSSYEHADIVVVDHSGKDDLTKLREFSDPRVTRLAEVDSLWWTGATNRGLKYALERHYPYIMLLNHDCFVRPDTIDLLVKAIFDCTECIVAPVQHNQNTGKYIVRATSCFLLGFSTLILPGWLFRFSRKKPMVPTSLIIGGRGVLISADTFRSVGQFDENLFPHYGADHDFYLRAKKNGYRLFVTTQAIVDIDDVKTSMAATGTRQTIRTFYETLFNRRSHRNLADQYKLFAKYYPVPYLGFVGVALNVVRYAIVMAVGNLLWLFSGKKRKVENQR
jgi:GT2 family glycosyltransferase